MAADFDCGKIEDVIFWQINEVFSTTHFSIIKKIPFFGHLTLSQVISSQLIPFQPFLQTHSCNPLSSLHSAVI